MKRFLIVSLLLLLPAPLLAQEVRTISLGEAGEISYVTSEVRDGVTYYYDADDALVLSFHDADLWLVYENGVAVREAHDVDGNGEPDVFFDLNANEQVTKSYGDGLSAFEKPEEVSLASLIADGGDASVAGDLVGDTSRITIPGRNGWVLPVVAILILGGLAYWQRDRLLTLVRKK